MNQTEIFFDINVGFRRYKFFLFAVDFPHKSIHERRTFVLNCNRCTVHKRFFNLNFVHLQKKGILGTRPMNNCF